MTYNQYPSFDEWFYEVEGFATRAERFYDELEMAKSGTCNNDTIVKWLRAAFDSARESQ